MVNGHDGKCYLTGRAIDINDPASFSFDHKIPVSRSGTNTLDNLGITCKQANQAKSDLTIDEFIQLCGDVIINFGFSDGNLKEWLERQNSNLHIID